MPLEFDAETHTYRLDGKVLPSVTQIIRAVLPGWEASEFYLQRGRAMHHGCRLLDEGRLDWSSVDPEIEPRINAWRKFKSQNPGIEMHCIEKPMASKRHCFAGTMDREILLPTFGLLICDLKSTIEPSVIVQLGGYRILRMENGGKEPNGGVAVELRDDGDFRTRWLDRAEMRKASNTFLACLSVFNFATANKLLKGNDQ